MNLHLHMSVKTMKPMFVLNFFMYKVTCKDTCYLYCVLILFQFNLTGKKQQTSIFSYTEHISGSEYNRLKNVCSEWSVSFANLFKFIQIYQASWMMFMVSMMCLCISTVCLCVGVGWGHSMVKKIIVFFPCFRPFWIVLRFFSPPYFFF